MSRKLRTALALVALAAAFAALAGCSYARIIRNRLPAPHRVDGGVLFQYEAPAARHLNLAGNWEENNWCGTKGTGRFDQTIGVMTDANGDGIWEITVPLKPGRYLYKYVIDWGVRWETDPNNPLTGVEGGITNSLVIVR
jgi:1,4-alpha-glucan branching enzyme